MENEKCFCHLNVNGERYQVKDAFARTKLEELENKTKEDIQALQEGAIKESQVQTLISEAIATAKQEIENDIIGALEGEY